MALRAPDVFTNVDGWTIFDVPEFAPYQEFVYLNGIKLTRTAEYTVTTLGGTSTVELVTPVVDPSDILEITAFEEVEGLQGTLDGILAAVAGSWRWDKQSGILTMYDTSGDEKFKFEVSDNAEESIRNRRQDLEI